jgi:hypothetical protein
MWDIAATGCDFYKLDRARQEPSSSSATETSERLNFIAQQHRQEGKARISEKQSRSVSEDSAQTHIPRPRPMYVLSSYILFSFSLNGFPADMNPMLVVSMNTLFVAQIACPAKLAKKILRRLGRYQMLKKRALPSAFYLPPG